VVGHGPKRKWEDFGGDFLVEVKLLGFFTIMRKAVKLTLLLCLPGGNTLVAKGLRNLVASRDYYYFHRHRYHHYYRRCFISS